jgi:hypothetical protein
MPRSINFRYLHLVLLPVYFIIHHYYVNFQGVSETDALVLLLVHLAVIAFIFFIARIFTRNASKAALLTTIIMLFLLFFGLAKDLIFQRSQLPLAVQYAMMVGVFVALLWLLYTRVLKRRSLEIKIHIFFTVVFALWIAFEVFNAIPVYKKASTHYNPVSYNPSGLKVKPSIYLLVLDEYPRKDALQKLFNFDNSHFLTQLAQRGFVIDSGSRSNYELTHLSMASTLSFDYLPFSGSPKNEDYGIAGKRLNKSLLWKMLKNEGYSITNYSIFTIDDNVPFRNTYTRQYHVEYFGRTLPGRLIEDFPSLFFSKNKLKLKREHREYIDRSYNENQLKRMHAHQAAAKPEFVYLHLMMPHPPYYMDSSGKAIDLINYKEKGNFINYMIYSNKVVLSIVDKIQKFPGQKVIYLLGDHGYRSDDTSRELFFDNLSALFSDPKMQVQQGVTNINQFRSIISQALRQNLPKVKDTSFYLTHGPGHFNFDIK